MDTDSQSSVVQRVRCNQGTQIVGVVVECGQEGKGCSDVRSCVLSCPHIRRRSRERVIMRGRGALPRGSCLVVSSAEVLLQCKVVDGVERSSSSNTR